MPVTGGAPDHGFVYAPVWFTDLGPGVRVEQSYGDRQPAGLRATGGRWRTAPAARRHAAGRPSVRQRRAQRRSLFGTEPLFRDHPKGEFAAGRAVHCLTMAHREQRLSVQQESG